MIVSWENKSRPYQSLHWSMQLHTFFVKYPSLKGKCQIILILIQKLNLHLNASKYISVRSDSVIYSVQITDRKKLYHNIQILLYILLFTTQYIITKQFVVSLFFFLIFFVFVNQHRQAIDMR